MSPSRCRISTPLLLTTALLGPAVPALAQPGAAPQTPAAQSPLERLGPDLLRIGTIVVDVAKKEITVPGVVNDVITLEFVATVKGGLKAYESALDLDTTAVNFNLALILIGLDHRRATTPAAPLDPTPPHGDLVDVWVEWEDGGTARRIRAEHLVYNEGTKQTLSDGPWVYTGSVFSAENKAYLAEIEGTLIGFVHSPAPVIESPRALLPGTYGATRLNPHLKLKPGTPVSLTVRARRSDK